METAPHFETPTDRHRAFAIRLALGASATQAYKLSGFKANSDTGIRVNAHKLASKPEIIAEVQKLSEDIAIMAARVTSLDRNWVLDKLRYVVGTSKNDAAVVRALELIGKELGLFINRSEVTRVDATQELDPTRLTWDELQTLLTLQRKARRPAPLAGQVVDTRALPAGEDEPAETLSIKSQD